MSKLKHIKVVVNNARYIQDPNSLSRLTQNTVMKVKKNGRKLNKVGVKKELNLKQRKSIRDKSVNNGFFFLNGFADYYRDIIKISYPTLYRRIYKNRDILNTLINNKMIEVFYSDLDNGRQRRMQVKVFRNKRKDFIKFIYKEFLTEYQK